MDALAFLDTVAKAKRLPVYVLAGDEDFLKRRCRDAIITLAVGKGGDADFAVNSYAGDKLDFSTVGNDLDTPSFMAPVRVVIVEQADPFVSERREVLERYVASPSKVGVLILDVKTFPETTKLAKALPDAAKLTCKAFEYPKQKERLLDWCVKWAKGGHGKKLSRDAAEVLVELVGSSMGLLDMELAKLATAAGTMDGERLGGGTAALSTPRKSLVPIQRKARVTFPLATCAAKPVSWPSVSRPPVVAPTRAQLYS